MNTTKRPAIGRHVRIKTKPYTITWMNLYPPFPTEGIVAPSNSFNPPNTLRLCPANNQMGESVIDWERIDSIEYLDGDDAAGAPQGVNHGSGRPAPTTVPQLQTWTVEGSKGNSYTVTKNGPQWSCNCVAGGFGRNCKHIKKIVEENEA